MAASYGKIGSFKAEEEEWNQYAERLEFFFAANGITEEKKKKAILLSVCGAQTYQLIRTLSAPTSLSDEGLMYPVLVQCQRAPRNPKPSAIVQRFRFNSHSRESGESIAALRQSAEHCDYKNILTGATDLSVVSISRKYRKSY